MRYHYSKKVRRIMRGLPARSPRRMISDQTKSDIIAFLIMLGYVAAFMAACFLYIA